MNNTKIYNKVLLKKCREQLCPDEFWIPRKGKIWGEALEDKVGFSYIGRKFQI